jgi:hypothetical protein
VKTQCSKFAIKWVNLHCSSAEVTRRVWDEEVNAALVRVGALLAAAEASLDAARVVSAHVAVM